MALWVRLRWPEGDDDRDVAGEEEA